MKANAILTFLTATSVMALVPRTREAEEAIAALEKRDTWCTLRADYESIGCFYGPTDTRNPRTTITHASGRFGVQCICWNGSKGWIPGWGCFVPTHALFNSTLR